MTFELDELIQPFLNYESFNTETPNVEDFTTYEQLSLTDLINNIKLDDSHNDSNPVISKPTINKPASVFVNYTNLSNNLLSSTKPQYVGKSMSRTQIELLMDQQGITGEKKQTLLKISWLESRFQPTIKDLSGTSTATGLFQMTDGTRKGVSSVSKQEFINNPSEQIRAASKLYDNCARQLQANGFKPSGENIAMMWLSPKWTLAYLRTGLNIGHDVNGMTPSKRLIQFRNVHLR